MYINKKNDGAFVHLKANKNLNALEIYKTNFFNIDCVNKSVLYTGYLFGIFFIYQK